MIDWLGNVGLEITRWVISIAVLLAGCFVGFKVHQLTDKQWLGAVAGLAAFAALALIFGPTADALQSEACENADDYEACVEGE